MKQINISFEFFPPRGDLTHGTSCPDKRKSNMVQKGITLVNVWMTLQCVIKV